ncbi:MAG: biopolymer transporter ExbD [Paracoccaceae bacterium]|nr:biopolymer transporter ExbD [Paracoccaceae bacterium]
MNFQSRRRARRGASLTPMVDVVFLLLFFFMLASRFGSDVGLPVTLGGAGTDWTGPPRLVDVLPQGVRLNGIPVELADLPAALDALMAVRTEPVVVAPRDGARTGDLVAAIDALRGAGFSRLVLAR